AYRYGFNGKEKDDNGEWSNVAYDYGFRIYDPTIARFKSTDPLTYSFPQFSPYQFAANSPIKYVDLDGLEALDSDKLMERVKKGINEAKKTANDVIDQTATASLIAVSKKIFPEVDQTRTEDSKNKVFTSNSDKTV